MLNAICCVAAERSRGNGQLAFPQLTARVPQIASVHEEAFAASLHHVFGIEIIHASATTGQDRTPESCGFVAKKRRSALPQAVPHHHSRSACLFLRGRVRFLVGRSLTSGFVLLGSSLGDGLHPDDLGAVRRILGLGRRGAFDERRENLYYCRKSWIF